MTLNKYIPYDTNSRIFTVLVAKPIETWVEHERAWEMLLLTHKWSRPQFVELKPLPCEFI